MDSWNPSPWEGCCCAQISGLEDLVLDARTFATWLREGSSVSLHSPSAKRRQCLSHKNGLDDLCGRTEYLAK